MRSLIPIIISSIIVYKVLMKNLLKDFKKNIKINEIPNSYNNFLYYFRQIPYSKPFKDKKSFKNQ